MEFSTDRSTMVALGEEATGPLLFRGVRPGPCRPGALRLLTDAGLPETTAQCWCDDGEVFALYDMADGPGEPPVGAAVVGPGPDAHTAEVRYLAVAPQRRGAGVASRLLAEVADALVATGARRLLAAASGDEQDRMTLLVKCGFRLAWVERDRGAHGAAPRDTVWFDRQL